MQNIWEISFYLNYISADRQKQVRPIGSSLTHGLGYQDNLTYPSGKKVT